MRSGLMENSSEGLPSSGRSGAGRGLQQLLGIDGDRVRLDARGGRYGGGDDLALGFQALDAGVDQALAELVDVEEAHREGNEAAEVQENDATREG